MFTFTDFAGCLHNHGIKPSWASRNCCYDKIPIERLLQTVKYEGACLHAYSDGCAAEINLARLLWRYCHVIHVNPSYEEHPSALY